MKIRIEISSGNMSYVMDKEADMDVNPQGIIEDIENILSSHEVDPDYIGCTVCDNYDVPSNYPPCADCVSDDNPYTNFHRTIY